MTADPDRARELFDGYLRQSPFARACGLRLTALEPDQAEVELPFDDSITTFADVVHGGAITTLIDVAAVAAAWSVVDPSKVTKGATVALSVQYLAAAKGEALRARARVTRRGSSISYCSVEVSGEDGRPVAAGLVTYKLG